VNRRLLGILAAALLGAAASALGTEVVVLKGGSVIPLKGPVVRRGSTAYITRADGTLLSVPVSEIDRDATAAANRPAAAPAASAAPAPATNPADAARTVGKDGQKAKVRITDADVSHPMDLGPGTGDDKDKKDKDDSKGAARVEVADYTREQTGPTLVVKGTLRNPGQGVAEGVRMSISAMDEKDKSIDGVNATLSKGSLDSGSTIEFTASLNVGDKTVANLRFQPQWTVPKPPLAAAPGQPGQPAGAGQAAANRPPAPVPTPYGRGTLYAAPVANATTEVPSDSHTGYLPSVSSPDNQPKPPTP
jgi:hypothetical protein